MRSPRRLNSEYQGAGRKTFEGDFSPLIHEADDGADTLAWVQKQPWSSGTYGMFGKSYFGATQWLAARTAPEGLQAIIGVVNRLGQSS